MHLLQVLKKDKQIIFKHALSKYIDRVRNNKFLLLTTTKLACSKWKHGKKNKMTQSSLAELKRTEIRLILRLF